MSSPINVDIAAMRSAATQFQSAHDTLQQQLTSVQSEFDGLSASWSGAAASGFQSAMQDFYSDAGVVLKNLQRIATDITTSAGSYSSTNDASSDVAAGLGRSISGAASGLPGF